MCIQGEDSTFFFEEVEKKKELEKDSLQKRSM